MSDYLPICVQAARAGGEALLRWVGRIAVLKKGPSDLVTEADTAAQKAVCDLLSRHFPGHDIVSEEDESPRIGQSEFCWFVDPLDGTTNYVHQVPHYAVSVALTHRRQPIAAAIFDPLSEECFTAARGEGAHLGERPLKASGVKELSQALVAASFAAKIAADSQEIDQFIAALLACQAVRRTGSAALNLAYVAAGRFDGFWALSTKSWDVAAGVLLVEEAGGLVSSVDGSPFELVKPHPLAAATPELHKGLRSLFESADRRKLLGSEA